MRALTSLTPALLTSLLLTGCDALGAFNYLQSGGVSPSYADIPYGASARQTLDLYLPEEVAAPAPLLVWFYGGGWDSGDKEKYAFVARRFTAMGYAVAIPNYRLVPEVRFPAFLDDAAAALARLRRLAEEQPGQISLQPMVLAGHSAGAYIAVQVVAGPGYLGRVGLGPEDVAGIIGLSGPYDFYPYKVDSSRNAFGDTPASQSQPVAQELSRMPPLLLISGNADETVRPRNSIQLAEKAPRAELQLVDGLGHAGTLLALGRYITTNRAVLEPLEQFLLAVSSAPPQGAME